MKCPRCGENSLVGWEYQLIDGNRTIARFFFVAVVLEQCPCGYKRFSDLHFSIPFFPDFMFFRSGFLKLTSRVLTTQAMLAHMVTNILVDRL